MNALLCAVDKHGKRLTSVASCTWEFRPGGVRMVSTVDLDVLHGGTAKGVEVLTLDGEHVHTHAQPRGRELRIRKGDTIRLTTAEMDFD